MAVQSDVKAKRLAAFPASLAVGPARIRTLHGTTSGAARLTITDGNGGSTVLDVDAQGAGTFTLELPDAGIRCSTDVYISTATGVSALTVIYS